MIDGIINNGCRGEELEKAQAEAHRTTPEKKPSIRERLEDAKRECAERKAPDKARPAEDAPGAGRLMSRSKKWRLEWAFFRARTADASTTSSVRDAFIPASRVSGRWCCPVRIIVPPLQKVRELGLKTGEKSPVAAFPCRGSMISHVGPPR